MVAVLAFRRSRGFDWRRSVIAVNASAQCGCQRLGQTDAAAGATLRVRSNCSTGEKQKFDWSDHDLIQRIGRWSHAASRERRWTTEASVKPRVRGSVALAPI